MTNQEAGIRILDFVDKDIHDMKYDVNYFLSVRQACIQATENAEYPLDLSYIFDSIGLKVEEGDGDATFSGLLSFKIAHAVAIEDCDKYELAMFAVRAIEAVSAIRKKPITKISEVERN